MHTFRQRLRVFVGRRVGPRMPQMCLNILDRAHVLRLGRYRSAHYLEVQLFDSQLLGERFEDPETVVGRIHEPEVAMGKPAIPSKSPCMLAVDAMTSWICSSHLVH